MKISRQVGTTAEILQVFIRDATNTSSAGLANISSANVSFSWFRNDMAAASTGTCSTSTGTLGTFTVSSLTQMSSSLMLGWYQFCPPDGLFVSGRSAALHLYGAANMAPVPIEIELTKSNNQVYVSTVNVLGSVNPVGASTITIPVGVSSISVGVNASTVSDKGGYGVSSLTAAATAAIADKVLGRNVSSGADGGRTVSEALYVLRNKVDAGAGIVYATDDLTTAWSFTVSTQATDPIVAILPV